MVLYRAVCWEDRQKGCCRRDWLLGDAAVRGGRELQSGVRLLTAEERETIFWELFWQNNIEQSHNREDQTMKRT